MAFNPLHSNNPDNAQIYMLLVMVKLREGNILIVSFKFPVVLAFFRQNHFGLSIKRGK